MWIIMKTQRFSIILGAVSLRFGLHNDPDSTGCIRYFDQLFSMLRNARGPIISNISRSRKTPSTFSGKPNVVDHSGYHFALRATK